MFAMLLAMRREMRNRRHFRRMQFPPFDDELPLEILFYYGDLFVFFSHRFFRLHHDISHNYSIQLCLTRLECNLFPITTRGLINTKTTSMT